MSSGIIGLIVASDFLYQDRASGEGDGGRAFGGLSGDLEHRASF